MLLEGEEQVGDRPLLAVVRQEKVMEVGEEVPHLVLDLGSEGVVATGEEILMLRLLGPVVDVVAGAVVVIRVGIGIGISIGRIAFHRRDVMIRLLRGVAVVGELEEGGEIIGARDLVLVLGLVLEARRGGGIVVIDFSMHFSAPTLKPRLMILYCSQVYPLVAFVISLVGYPLIFTKMT